MSIGKREFSKNPLRYITEVQETGKTMVVTHRGVPEVVIRKLTAKEQSKIKQEDTALTQLK